MWSIIFWDNFGTPEDREKKALVLLAGTQGSRPERYEV
jgi:hypothetical protein